jgi:type II secretion system protein G
MHPAQFSSGQTDDCRGAAVLHLCQPVESTLRATAEPNSRTRRSVLLRVLPSHPVKRCSWLAFVLASTLATASLTGCGVSDAERWRVVGLDLQTLRRAIEKYHSDTGVYPEEQQGLNALRTDPHVPNWRGPYVWVRPVDPWLVAYRYQRPDNTSYIISSAGPDQVFGSADDIVVEYTNTLSQPEGEDDALGGETAEHGQDNNAAKTFQFGYRAIPVITCLPFLIPILLFGVGLGITLRVAVRTWEAKFRVRAVVVAVLSLFGVLILTVLASSLLTFCIELAFRQLLRAR